MNGSCLCGQISFALAVQHINLYQCHCQLCQKQSGSTSNTATVVKEQQFQWLTGENNIQQWQKESGFTAHFCRHCGSPVPNKLRNTPYYWIPMGLINDSLPLKITHHFFCQSKAPWDQLSEGNGEQYSEIPESLADFIALLED